MVRRSLALLWLCCLTLAGAEPELRIADAIGDAAVREAAIRWTLSGGAAACRQERVTLDRALAGLRKGEYDLVLAYRSALPEALRGRGRDYAIEAAMIAVNAANVRSDFSAKALAEIFSGWRRSWKTLNGEEFQIHLMRLEDGAGPVGIFRRKIMGGKEFAPAFVRRDGDELLRLTELNEHAITLTGRPDAELSIGIKAASVDGVAPSIENLKNGRYPLADRRVALTAETPSAGAGSLLEFMRLPDMAAVFAGYGLMMP